MLIVRIGSHVYTQPGGVEDEKITPNEFVLRLPLGIAEARYKLGESYPMTARVDLGKLHSFTAHCISMPLVSVVGEELRRDVRFQIRLALPIDQKPKHVNCRCVLAIQEQYAP